MVRSISESRVFILRQQTQVLWEQYFSSIEKIVFTTLEVSEEQLYHENQRSIDELDFRSISDNQATFAKASDP